MANRSRRSTLWIFAVVFITVLIGSLYLWQKAEAQNEVLRQEAFQLHDQVDVLEKEIIALKENPVHEGRDQNLDEKQASDHLALEVANQVLVAIRDQDGEAWAEFVHPDQGVRFSAYGNVNKEIDQVLTQEQMRTIFSDPTSYSWGVFDGTGDPIVGDFQMYYQEFIYDVDFRKAPEVSLNHVLGHGNIINNLTEIYPEAVVVEYYFSGFDPQYGGMDWRSLRLVLEQKDGIWYLVGVVHDEWTT